MIHVMHVITEIERGGAEAMLAKLVAGMDKDRFHNTVVSLTRPGDIAASLRYKGVPVRTLGMRRSIPDPAGLWRLVRLFRSERPDIVQTWLYHADLLGSIAAALAGRTPVVWNIRCSNVVFHRYGRLTRWVVRASAYASAWPQAVIVNSQSGLLWHQALGYRPRRWEVVPNGFDLDRFRPDREAPARLRRDLDIPEQSLVVGHVARVDPMKDHATFLAAARLLAARREDVHFLLVGAGTEALAADGLTGRVHRLGERSDVERLLPGLDVLCLSSAFGEGFPNVLGEAMACALPCIATDVGDAAAIVGDTGRIVPPRDPAALAEAIEALLKEGSEARARLGLAARARIAEHYALPKVIERYQKLYAELANPPPERSLSGSTH
jgi:glycosyltransferase involved in cell wall biosynthesis